MHVNMDFSRLKAPLEERGCDPEAKGHFLVGHSALSPLCSSFQQLDAMRALPESASGGFPGDQRAAMRLRRFLMKVEKMPVPCNDPVPLSHRSWQAVLLWRAASRVVVPVWFQATVALVTAISGASDQQGRDPARRHGQL